jgi:hypothetical protein
MTATLVLLTCIICPLAETFDHWDHTLQTGNDTEYALVVLALSVGVSYSLVRFTFKPTLLGLIARSVFVRGSRKTFLSTSFSLALSRFDEISPPSILALRI